jgi:hypothetical protein
VTLDERINWSPHFDQFRKKTAQRIGMLNPLMNGRVELSIRNSVLLYKPHIPSIKGYACSAGGSAAIMFSKKA